MADGMGRVQMVVAKFHVSGEDKDTEYFRFRTKTLKE